jgi:hypothetical protein
MDTLELLKQLRFNGSYDSTQSAELASYNMVLHRQLNYIFRGFEGIIKDNRIRFHISHSWLELNQPESEIQLFQTLLKDMEHIVQMAGSVAELYIANIEEKEQHMGCLECLFDNILNCQSKSSVETLHDIIQTTYEEFSKNLARRYPITWEKNWKYHENILDAYNEGSLKLGSEIAEDFSTTGISRSFRKKFNQTVDFMISLLYTKSLLGKELDENEIALLTFIVKDLGGQYGDTTSKDEEDSEKDKKKKGRKSLTYILKNNEWEKIEYSMRCRLWKHIERLIIKDIDTVIVENDCGEMVAKEEISYDYSIIKKYLCVIHEDDIPGILALIEQKIKFPKIYRIMNMLSDMTSFFASSGIEDNIDTEVLDQFEKELAKLHKIASEIEQNFPAEEQYIEQIWAAIQDNARTQYEQTVK